MIITYNTVVDTSNAEDMAGSGVRVLKNSDRPIIQNLGPGTLYLGTSTEDLYTVGLQLPPNAVYEMPATLVDGAGKVCLLAAIDDCDVRILNVG